MVQQVLVPIIGVKRIIGVLQTINIIESASLVLMLVKVGSLVIPELDRVIMFLGVFIGIGHADVELATILLTSLQSLGQS